MKNRSFLVEFEHLKIQGGKLNGLAAWYFSCSIPGPRFMNFSSAAPPPPPPPALLIRSSSSTQISIDIFEICTKDWK